MFQKESNLCCTDRGAGKLKNSTHLWKDDAGFVVSTELVLVATILVIGMVVGLATVRNAVVQELGDVATAIGSINQSYSYSGVTGRSTTTTSTAGSKFADMTDFCDSLDVPDGEPAGISVQVAGVGEGIAP